MNFKKYAAVVTSLSAWHHSWCCDIWLKAGPLQCHVTVLGKVHVNFDVLSKLNFSFRVLEMCWFTLLSRYFSVFVGVLSFQWTVWKHFYSFVRVPVSFLFVLFCLFYYYSSLKRKNFPPRNSVCAQFQHNYRTDMYG